ncbi:MAG TPA: TetR/AcrR family transcriptional regulator [Pirellulales bacterium]|jgi:AcrR family transcriptional regulator
MSAEVVSEINAAEPERAEIPARIARAAAHLFATAGYDATSVRHVVEAASVTKPTLYYYFESKEGLARALLNAPIGRLTATIESLVTGPLPATEKLAALIDEHLKLCRDDPDMARFAYALFFGPRSSKLAIELADLGQLLVESVHKVICCLADERVIGADRIEECTAAARGLICIYTMDFLYRDLVLPAELSQRLVVDLLQGFGQQRAASGAKVERN